MRNRIPYPCSGPSDTALRISRSSVPCKRSSFLAIPLLECQGEHIRGGSERSRRRRRLPTRALWTILTSTFERGYRWAMAKLGHDPGSRTRVVAWGLPTIALPDYRSEEHTSELQSLRH